MSWKNGVGKLSNHERHVALESESKARALALTDTYEALTAATGSLVVDCSDLAVRSSAIRWIRRKGFLYLDLRVHLTGTYGTRVYKWRTPVPGRKR